MLQAELDWVLTCFEIDREVDIEFLQSGPPDCAHNVNDLSSNHRNLPQSLPFISSKKGIACSEDLSLIFTSYLYQSDKAMAEAEQNGYMRNAAALSKRLQNIGMPDMDICALFALLLEDMNVTEIDEWQSCMINATYERVSLGVKIWRLVAYCKLLASLFCSQDKLVVADVAKQELSQNALNVFDFDTVESLLSGQDSRYSNWKMEKDTGEMMIEQMSPFDAIGKLVRRMTCIPEVPFSYLQGLSFLSTNGGFMSDPWVLEPSLSTDSPTFYQSLALQISDYIKTFLLQGYLRRAQSVYLLKNVVPTNLLSPHFVPGTIERLRTICKGNNISHMRFPIEILRDYCDRSAVVTTEKKPTPKVEGKVANRRVTMSTKDILHDRGSSAEYTHAQITLRFWTAFRRENIAQTAIYERSMSDHLKYKRKVKHSGSFGKGMAATGPTRRLSSIRCGQGIRGSQVHIQVQRATKESEEQRHFEEDKAQAARIRNKEDNTVLDLLNLEKSVQGFSDIIESAISDEQDANATPTAFGDTIGILMNPLHPHDTRNSIEVALEYESQLHQPLQKSVCLWAFSHHKPLSIVEVEKVVNKSHESLFAEKRNGISPVSKHCPSFYERRRRIEMSLLLQFSVR